MPPSFIVIDGPDGSGTTTHTKVLAEHLQKKGVEILLTSEPTDGPIGQSIRGFLKNGSLPPDALQLLFTADRAHHIHQIIKPSLASGKTVICDRYASSTIAYGMALGLDRRWLEELNKNFIRPNHLFFLLPSLDVCMERLSRRTTVDILEGKELQKRVHEAYRALAEDDPTTHVIDSGGSKEDTAAQIAHVVMKNS